MSMKSKVIASVAAVLAMAVTVSHAASGISVRQVAKVNGTNTEIWAKVGGFCAIKDWHPALAGCEESKEGDATFRTLTLKDGGKIKEKLTGTSETGYTYQIIESPLPVKDYSASFSARADNDEPGKAVVVWSASFAAKGKPDSEARGVIEGIFKDGLKSISDGAAK
jgi:hypothetical protein